MLPYPGQAPYFCSECKEQYSSASSLLNHFAQHITERHGYQTNQTDSEGTDSKPSTGSKFLLCGQNERKAESILENVLKQTLTSQILRTDLSECNNHDSSTSISEYYCSSSSDTNNCLSEQESQIPQPVVELEEQYSICAAPNKNTNNLMLVKFDLQKRLENCILKLASKRDTKMETSTGPVLNISQNSWETSGIILPVINSRDLTVTVASNTNNTEHEEFNPLKFCIVTMEEGEDKLDLDRSSQLSIEKNCQNTGSLKGSSTRKQLAPKKLLVEEKKNYVNLDILKEEKSSTKKKYPCLVCCKVFGWSTDLKRHILTHTGERPFRCQRCPATFTRNFLLQKHESKQHQSVAVSPSTPIDLKPSTTEQTIGKGASTSTKAVVCSSERKRKLQRSINGKFESNIIEKRLELHQCNPISVGIFSQQALNIS